jgi:hypothetical protein
MADVIGYQCCVCGGDPRTEGLRHERPKNVTIIILCDLVDDVWTFVTFLRGTTYKTSAESEHHRTRRLTGTDKLIHRQLALTVVTLY